MSVLIKFKRNFFKDNLYLFKTYPTFKKRLKHLPMFKSFSLWRMKMLTKTRNYTSEELYSIEILLLEEKASALKIKTEPGCRRKAIKSDCISCKAQRRFFLLQICFRRCWKHLFQIPMEEVSKITFCCTNDWEIDVIYLRNREV